MSTGTGPGQPRSVVLVHGLWSGPYDWRWVQPLLERAGVGVVAVDLPSHSSAEAAIREDGEAVSAAIRACEPPVVVAAWSSGGDSMNLGAEGEAGVARLVYVASYPSPPHGDLPEPTEWLDEDLLIRRLGDGTFVLDTDLWLEAESHLFDAAVLAHLKPTTARIIAWPDGVIRTSFECTVLRRPRCHRGWWTGQQVTRVRGIPMTAPRSGARLAAVAAALALPLVAVPAAGEEVTVRDARGDMIRVVEGGGDPQPAPGATVGDVVRTTFRHTDRQVVVRTKLAGLERTGRRFTVWVDVQNGARRTWTVGVEATRRDRNGHTIFMTGRGRDVSCAVRHRINYADNVVRLSVPRRCLDTPRVVRFRLLTEHVRRSWDYAWLDNGLAVAMEDRHWTRWLGRE